MITTLKSLLLSHPLLKAFAIFAGYSFWLLLASNQITTRTMKIPLLFYNVPEATVLESPQEVAVTVKGKRSFLQEIEKHNPSVHLDAGLASQDEQELSISFGDILLPNSVNLVNYTPETITVYKKAEEEA